MLALAMTFAALLVQNACGLTTHYVNANGTNPVSPYISWATAATNIQDAINAAVGAGDIVLVTNGVYQSGSFAGSRVYLDITLVQSVNGPAFTRIQGYQIPGTTNGATALRCVYIKSGTLSGFTLTGGATATSGYGGGVYCNSTNCLVTNCVITGNAAYSGGAGAYSGTLVNCSLIGNATTLLNIGTGGGANNSVLINCLLANNFAGYTSGGAANSTLVNCTVVSNVAGAYAGSVWGCTVRNSIVYYNFSYYTNSDASPAYAFSNCCVSFPTNGLGANNFTNPPLFANLPAGDFHLKAASPCINAGDNSGVTNSTDLDGNLRIVGGTVDLGAYEFQSPIHYVKTSAFGATPVSPFTNWITAATNIQDAVDAATNGDLVLVTNGIYAVGGRKLGSFDVTNRIMVTNSIVVQSVNGPAVTVIQGYQVPGTIAATNAVRCAFIGSGAVLSGFTLTNGEAGTGNYVNGGGVSGAGTGSIVSNCVLTGNVCAGAGGGADNVALIDCLFRGNYGVGGGAAAWSALVRCVLTNNLASWAGGILSSKATNCLIANNSATNYGGGSGFSTLVNCTITGNSLAPGHGGNGGGSYNDTLLNSIVYNNTAPNGSNYFSSGMNFCCTAPLPGGAGNFTNPPLFVNPVAGDFHLQSNSACINSGNNAYVTDTLDLDGNPRIAGGTVDAGAYEYQTPTSVISYAWLQTYGLPTDGTADYTDSDGDGMNNYQEWIAGTDPTNPLSLLEMLSLTPTNSPSGIIVSWQSVGNRTYFLQSSVSLGSTPAFSTIQSNIIGLPGTTSYTDTNAVGDGPFFYRVGVQ